MQRQKTPVAVQIGIALAVAGVAVKIALVLGAMLSPIANLAILAGVILIIVGLVLPSKKY